MEGIKRGEGGRASRGGERGAEGGARGEFARVGAELLPQLYLHGLAEGGFELALRGLLGEGAPLSASSIERLRVKWQLEYEQWKSHRLDPPGGGGARADRGCREGGGGGDR